MHPLHHARDWWGAQVEHAYAPIVGHAADARCPSQERLSWTCPCVKRSLARRRTSLVSLREGCCGVRCANGTRTWTSASNGLSSSCSSGRTSNLSKVTHRVGLEQGRTLLHVSHLHRLDKNARDRKYAETVAQKVKYSVFWSSSTTLAKPS